MRQPLLLPILFFLAGIFIADALVEIPASGGIVFLSALLILALITVFRWPKLFFAVLCVFFLVLGVQRYIFSCSHGSDASIFKRADGKKITLYGTVLSDPEWRFGSYNSTLVFPFEVKGLLFNREEKNIKMRVLVKIHPKSEKVITGDKLLLGGKFKLPENKEIDGFDYKKHLRRKGISALLYSSKGDVFQKVNASNGPVMLLRRFLARKRASADSIVRKKLTYPASAIVESIVLGIRWAIPESLRDVFARTGTMHILAVSGLHIGIIAVVMLTILRSVKCPQKLTYILTIAGIYTYAVFVGSRASSMRAAIMGSFVFLGLLLGRKVDVLYVLFLSAFCITFFSPGQLFFPGFVLSYLAVLSILYLVPLTDFFFGFSEENQHKDRRGIMKKSILKSISLSLAVWLGMMPVIASYFNIITPSVIISNMIAVPFLFISAISGFVLILTGSFYSLALFSKIMAIILDIIIVCFVKILTAISQISFLSVKVVSPGIFFFLTYYTALLVLILLFYNGRKVRIHLIMFLLFICNLFVWNEIF
ncbi:MAG: ComEC/Rec2 family competence protein [Candidatus Omnitrophica bacterium]|nr:ComEC/Rec2 family competence protein [Candidatus Omnitrophota bacterium]